MPSVASEARTHALKPLPPASLRPASAPAPDRAPPAPFETMLDETAQAAQPDPQSKPAPSDQTARSAKTDQPSARGSEAKPANDADGGKQAAAGKSDKAAKADQTDQTTDDAIAADGKSDGGVKTDAKSNSKTDIKTDALAAGADQLIAPADAGTPADTNPAACSLAAPVAAGPVQSIADNGTPAAAPPPAIAAVAAVAVLNAPPSASPAKNDAADAKGKPAVAVAAAQSGADLSATADAKVPAKTVAPAHADGKAAADANGKAAADTDDKPAATLARAHDAEAQPTTAPAAGTGEHAAAPKPGADVLQPSPLGAPPPHVSPAANAASAAPAPAPQLAHAAAQAVPLAGVAIEIAGKALAGKNHFDIRLDPPELGRIEVRLVVDRDGRITSHVIADRRDTLDLLQRDASGLQRAFQDAGLKTSDNGLQFSLRDQSAGQERDSTGSNSAPLAAEVETTLDPLPINYARLAGSGAGLDIRV